MWVAFQLSVGIGFGCLAMWWDRHLWGYSPSLWGGALPVWGFIVGLTATRAIMFGIAWYRFGWAAARSVRMLD